MPSGCTSRRCQILTAVLAATAIITILVILFLFNYPSLVKKRTIEDVVFRNGTLEMTRFKTTTDLVNLRLEFYVFNVTNADEVVTKSAKINLQEIGPFVYHEYKYREILENNQTTGLITYKLRKRYTFQRHLSVADSKTINIVWPNVPLLVAEEYISKLSFISREAAYIFINRDINSMKEPAFITDTVDNFVFSGSKRDLFAHLQSYDVFKWIKPWPLKDNKFALLYGKNDTWDPEKNFLFTTSAGYGQNRTYKDLNRYVKMNGSSVLPFWDKQPSACNELSGTDGEFFSPFLEKNEEIEVYSPDICRKIQLKYRQTTYVKGITVWKYSFDDKSLQSGIKNPSNQCYCLAKNSECLLDGLIDLSTCISPNILASGAHFATGSPELRSRVSGVTQPNSSIHDPTLYIEPNTGITIVVKVPLQFNVRLSRSRFDNLKFYNDSEPTIVPLLWVSEDAEMTDDQASMLKSKLLLLDSWFVLAMLGGAIIFVTTIIVIASIVCLRYRDSRIMARSQEADERSPLLRHQQPQPRRGPSTGSLTPPRASPSASPLSHKST